MSNRGAAFRAARRSVLVAGLVAAIMWAPGVQAQPVIPALSGRVVDAADVLPAAVEAEVTSLLEEHERQSGNQVAVLTVASLGGYSVEEYALAVAREWRLGTAENDNGVLLLLAIEDREMRIEVGYGLEGNLPDAIASRILRNDIRPHLRRGDYAGGVRAGVASILSAIEGSYVASEEAADRPPFLFGMIFLVVPSLFAFMGILSTGCARWFLFVFLVPFFWVAGFALTGSWIGGVVLVAVYALVYILAQMHPRVRELQKTMKEKGSVRIGGVVVGEGGFGGSSGGFSGGGFSGGGGSFGGGGASGSW